MSTTLAIESFNEINLRERTTLSADVLLGAEAIQVKSTQGYSAGDILYVGQLAREGVEKAVIASVDGETTINLVEPLKRSHAAYTPVTSVLGDLIHVYRAANINGQVPSLDAFTVLATRSIDPDQQTTYYTDSAGGSQYWYLSTYYNVTTNVETDLLASTPVRGDDFGHYASLTEIRREAGFENAHNLSDVDVDQQRRAAESEINATLAGNFKTPFSPVPQIIKTVTIQLAAALLKAKFLPGTAGDKELKDIRTRLEEIRLGSDSIVDDDGNSIAVGTGVASWPDESEPRAFTVGMRF